MQRENNILHKIFHLYYDGFRAMTLGRKLWAIIIIKLFIIFAILRLFFFPNFLNTKCEGEGDKASYVGRELIDRGGSATQ